MIRTLALHCLLMAAVITFTGCRESEPRPAVPPGPAAAKQASSGEGRTSARGAGLARQYCSACHLFPEPQLLTRREWAHHILPQMAVWLGIEPINYEAEKDGRMLEAAGIFPSSAILPEEDWFAIWDFYLTSSPIQQPAGAERSKPVMGLEGFRARKLNFHAGAPMTSLVKIDAAQRRIFVGDSFARVLAALDATGRTLGTAPLGNTPVSLSDQPAGRYVTLIGRMFPSEALEGSVVYVPKSPAAAASTLLEGLRRPTHTAVGDLNQDGRADLVVSQFGHRLGRLSWFEAQADGRFAEHILLEQPGALRSELRDLNRDGRLDIITLFAHAREGLQIFYNLGGGQFRLEPAFEQPPSFGYAGFELVDFNQDGWLDVLAANGDNGDFPTPRKPYHGLRIHLNDRTNHFRETWFYPMEGAYDARAADFDGDGDLDIAAIAYFPDFQKRPVESFVYLENRGGLNFQPRLIPESDSGRWITMDVGDVNGDGDADIVLGSFTGGPTTIPIPATLREHWKTNGAAVLLLENLAK